MSLSSFCTVDFEENLDILIEHILGWDLDLEHAKEGGGAFGDLEARFGAVEEQGRKTLHIHFQLWVKHWRKLLKLLKSLFETKKRRARESYPSTVCR